MLSFVAVFNGRFFPYRPGARAYLPMGLRPTGLQVLLFAAGALFVWGQWRAGRSGMADFRVYFDAAATWAAGGSPYGQAFGVSSGFYKYAPVALVPFFPLVALGWAAARWVYWALLLALFAWGMPRLLEGMHRLLSAGQTHSPIPHRALLMLALVLCSSHHVGRELLLGNVNAVLLAALGGWWWTLNRAARFDDTAPGEASGRGLWTGVAAVGLGAIWAFKPHFLVLLPWLVVRRPLQHAVLSVLAFAGWLLLPAIGVGWEENLGLLGEWWETIRMHNTDTSHSSNTLASWWGLQAPWNAVPPLLVMAAWGAWVLHRRRRGVGERGAFLEVAVVVALLPNLVHTDTEHFMWSLPLVAVWLLRVADARYWPSAGQRWGVASGLVLCMVPYALGTPDLWGRELAAWLERGGPLGAANLILVAGAVWMWPGRTN